MVFDVTGSPMGRLVAYRNELKTFTDDYDCSNDKQTSIIDDDCTSLNNLKQRYIRLFTGKFSDDFVERRQLGFDEAKADLENQLRTAHSTVYNAKLDVDIEIKERVTKRSTWSAGIPSSIFAPNDVGKANTETDSFIRFHCTQPPLTERPSC